MRIIGLFLIVLYLITGCAAHSVAHARYIHSSYPEMAIPIKTYQIWIDQEFGVADRIAIDDAIKQWNYAFNGMIKLEAVSYQFDMDIEELKHIMSVGGWIILKIRSDNSMVVDRIRNGKVIYTLAWVNDIGGRRMWVIRDRIENGWVTGVVMHEIGHLLGVEHDNIYLMAPRFDWETMRCVDYEAAKRAATYQRVPFNHMNYCVYDNVKN